MSKQHFTDVLAALNYGGPQNTTASRKKNPSAMSSLEDVQRSVQSAAIPVDRSYPPFSLEVDAAWLSALALVFCKLWSRFSIFLF